MSKNDEIDSYFNLNGLSDGSFKPMPHISEKEQNWTIPINLWINQYI